MKTHYIDLRSDTVTHPTKQMRQAMSTCPVGDDVIGEDPTINKLEQLVAKALGKEAGLFVPSGTFSNQCAILTHTKSGNEIILSEDCHIVQHEAGAAALISRVQLRAIKPQNGSYLQAYEIEARIRMTENIHFPKTSLICLEQATSFGHVIPLEILKDIYKLSKQYKIPIHIDGARLFNAATFLKCKPRELAALSDSVTVCLSKGLCSPVGSVLTGTKEFIAKARANRKIMGGGLRQAGVLASCGIISINKMAKRLDEDHKNAKFLATELSKIKFIKVTRNPEINMVFIKIENKNANIHFVEELKKKKILTYPRESGEFRFVTHNDVSTSDIKKVISEISKFMAKFQ